MTWTKNELFKMLKISRSQFNMACISAGVMNKKKLDKEDVDRICVWIGKHSKKGGK